MSPRKLESQTNISSCPTRIDKTNIPSIKRVLKPKSILSNGSRDIENSVENFIQLLLRESSCDRVEILGISIPSMQLSNQKKRFWLSSSVGEF